MDSALIVKRTFIEVADESPAHGCKGLRPRASSDSALLDTLRRMSALSELDDLLADGVDEREAAPPETAALQRAATEGAGGPLGGDARVRRPSNNSTRCPSVAFECPSGMSSPALSSTRVRQPEPLRALTLVELPVGSPLSSSTASYCWADQEDLDDDLVSWTSDITRFCSFKTSEAGPWTSLFTENNSSAQDGKRHDDEAKMKRKMKRAARGGAAGRRQRAARETQEAIWEEPVARDAQTGSSPETAEQDGEVEGEARATFMLRDLPDGCTRDTVQAMLDNRGLVGEYDFLYVPIDFKTRANLGHAIVNFVSSNAAMVFLQTFDGSVTANVSCNGLEALAARYQNSPVMHPAVPDDYRPAIFQAGRRANFPAPSKEPRLLRSLVDAQRTV